MAKNFTSSCQTGAASSRMSRPYRVSMTRNRPARALGSGKYCFTSFSEKA
jgi:hypothetical protein